LLISLITRSLESIDGNDDNGENGENGDAQIRIHKDLYNPLMGLQAEERRNRYA
jgi:hypothetical protein